MTHAYTPGLRISEKKVVTSHRSLPLLGDVIVKKGDVLKAEDVVARAHLPGKVLAINAVNRLGIQPKDLKEYMLKKEGDAGKSFLKWFVILRFRRMPASWTSGVARV